MSDYEVRGHVQSLEAARRGGEYLTNNYLPPNPKFNIFHGGWWGGCSVDVLDQIVRLHCHTQQPKLLELAAYMSDNYPPMRDMRASGKAQLTHAYVLCAYMGGEVLYAQAANRPDELKWIEPVWDELVRQHVFPTFSTGVNERLVADKPLRDLMGDPPKRLAQPSNGCYSMTDCIRPRAMCVTPT